MAGDRGSRIHSPSLRVTMAPRERQCCCPDIPRGREASHGAHSWPLTSCKVPLQSLSVPTARDRGIQEGQETSRNGAQTAAAHQLLQALEEEMGSRQADEEHAGAICQPLEPWKPREGTLFCPRSHCPCSLATLPSSFSTFLAAPGPP